MNSNSENDRRYIVYLIVIAVIITSLLFHMHYEKERRIQCFFDAIKKDDVTKAKAFLEKDPGLVNSKDKIMMGFLPLCESKSRKMIDLLISYGADANARTVDNATPLHMIVNFVSIDSLELLISKGADVNARNSNGSTPLFSVASTSGINTAQFLISKGADVNAQDNEGNTPLFIAARTGQLKMVKFLISKGVDPTIKNTHGKTALDCTIGSEYTTDKKSLEDIADLLRKHGAKE